MKHSILMSFFLVIAVYGMTQTNYYVSTTGNNSNDGSLANPWLSIQYGMDQLTPGDTLNIMTGSYFEKLQLNVSGAEGEMLTIRAGQGQEVKVDAINYSDDIPIFYAHNRSYYRIQGIHFTNCFHHNGAGFYVDGFGHYIELTGCKFSNIAISTNPNAPVNDDTNQPIVSFIGDTGADSLSHILVADLEIFNCRPGYSECLAIGGNTTDFEFINNHIHDNTNIGIDATGNYQNSPVPTLDHARRGLIKNNHCHHNQSPYSAAAGIYVDGGYDIIVENNLLHHNDYGGEIGCEESGSAKNIIFRNNIIYHNTRAGLALGGYDASTGGYVENCKVTNNTFYQNDSDEDGNGELLFTQFENSEVINNIFYLSDHNYLMSNDRDQPNLRMEYNLVFNTSGAANVETYWDESDLVGLANIYNTIQVGNNASYGDPLFENISSFDFHINADSPAINAGDPSFIASADEFDLDGEVRVSGGRVDCGADERPESTADFEPENTSFTLFPNPTNGPLILVFEQELKGSLSLKDLHGKQLFQKSFLSQKVSLDLNHLPKGIYLVVIYTEYGVSSRKITLK